MAHYEIKLSSRVNGENKSEIMLRYVIARGQAVQVKTGVFVDKLDFDDKIPVERYVELCVNALGRIVEEYNEARSDGKLVDESVTAFVKRVVAFWSTPEHGADWKKLRSLTYFDIERAFQRKAEAEALAAQKAAEEAARLKAEEESKKRKDIFRYIEEYCEVQSISKKRSELYRALARILLRFQYWKQETQNVCYMIDYDTIEPDDIEEFRMYLLDEKELVETYHDIFSRVSAKVNEVFPVTVVRAQKARGDNYSGDVLTKLKTVFKWLREKGITSNDPFKGIKISQSIYGDPIYLTKEERDIIANYESPLFTRKNHYELYRDIFIFQCYIGARYGDLCCLRQDNIEVSAKDGKSYLNYMANKTKKTTGKKVRVPLTAPAIELIKKYKGVESDFLFPFPDENTINAAIKRIFEICGVCRKVVKRNATTGEEEVVQISNIAATHMARKTFIGTLYKAVKDPNLISKMSGHVEGSKSFSRYRDIDDEDLQQVIATLE